MPAMHFFFFLRVSYRQRQVNSVATRYKTMETPLHDDDYVSKFMRVPLSRPIALFYRVSVFLLGARRLRDSLINLRYNYSFMGQSPV